MKRVSALIDAVRRPRPGLVVLIYHRVGRRTPIEVDLPAAQFDAQMAFLASTGTVGTLAEGLAAVTGASAGPARLAVTFDDGTADFADVSLPILAEQRVPALLYLATDFIEGQRPFPHDGLPLSWAALRDCLASGLVTVGSHTHTHLLLDRADAATVREDLDRSIGLIEDRLGVSPSHFAYPKAVLGSPAAQAEVRTRFASAAVAGTRANAYGATDVYHLFRSPVQLADGTRWFRRKVEGGMTLEDAVRRIAGRVRYRDLTT